MLFRIALSIALVLGVGCAQQNPSPAPAQPAPVAKVDPVARGQYLVEIAGCHDCHSPKADAQMTPDMNLALSGRPLTTPAPKQIEGNIVSSMDLTAWSGPWGVSYASNLTPDPDTGIGRRYDEAKFIQAIRTGKKPEGEPLLPPMPWPAYKHMTDEDLKAVFAYLTSLKPMSNFVRASGPPKPSRP